MIHYITSNGIGNAWVANELSRIDAARVPFVLHAMRRPDKLLHGSEWALRMNQQTMVIYPLPALQVILSVLLAPISFGRFLRPSATHCSDSGNTSGPGGRHRAFACCLSLGPQCSRQV